MANKRMFSLSVVDTDNFIEMPISSRLLYYELGMRADDDGFVDSVKKILAFTGLKEDDLKVLITKKFLIPFDNGVIVIRHWRLNNYLQKDRYKETIYQEEKAQLAVDNTNVYSLYTECKHSIDKNSIDKISIGKNKKQFIPPTLEEVEKYVSDKELKVNAEQFYNYFTEGNWVDSKGNKVKSWKQKILTWNGYVGTVEKETKKSYQNYEQRDIKNFDNFYAN